MYTLSREKKSQIIHGLVEGCSIRSLERMTDVHRDTIMRLLVRTGDHCAAVLDQQARGVKTGVLQVDEAWTFTVKKDKRLTAEERSNPELGSQFVFIAMDAETKFVPAFMVGKRTPAVTTAFIRELESRVGPGPIIVTDGFIPYIAAIRRSFRGSANHAMLIKRAIGDPHPVGEGYGPGRVIACDKELIAGYVPERDVSTSMIERQNWTLRTFNRRMTRLSNGFSRKLENLRAALNLWFVAYNFTRVHRTLRITPAMAAGVTNTIWPIEELLPD